MRQQKPWNTLLETTPKNIGPDTKLSLKKILDDLEITQLSQRFEISGGFWKQNFNLQKGGMAESFTPFV